jgi:hypothetical protein
MENENKKETETIKQTIRHYNVSMMLHGNKQDQKQDKEDEMDESEEDIIDSEDEFKQKCNTSDKNVQKESEKKIRASI